MFFHPLFCLTSCFADVAGWAFNMVDDIFFVRNSSLIFKFAELIFHSITWLVIQFYVNFL